MQNYHKKFGFSGPGMYICRIIPTIFICSVVLRLMIVVFSFTKTGADYRLDIYLSA